MKKKKLLKDIERLCLELDVVKRNYERALFDDDVISRNSERIRYECLKKVGDAWWFGNMTDFGNGKG